MNRIKAGIHKAIKRTPLKKLAECYARRMTEKGAWKTEPYAPIQEAREKIEALRAKQDGHAYWETPYKSGDRYDLSVIVPFYNSEKYAKRCIESILNQKTTVSFEVILVNDGSPDGCKDILDQYADRKNVKVIHKENGGMSDARNCGIREATGRYCFFCDSDDYLPDNTFEVLMSTAAKYHADIVDGSHYLTTPDKRVQEMKHSFQVGTKGKGMFGFCWGKVIKMSLFDSICFPKGYWFEDTIVSLLLFAKADVTVTIPEFTYYYCTNKTGISWRSRGNPKSIDILWVLEEIFDTLKKINVPITDNIRNMIVLQVSKYVYLRCGFLEDDKLKCIFRLCAEIAEKYGCLEDTFVKTQSFWGQEVCGSFQNMQFSRWKLAAKMI